MIINKQSYQKRLIRLVALSLLGIILIYLFSLRRTINLIKINSSGSNQIESFEVIKMKLQSLYLIGERNSEIIIASDDLTLNKRRIELLGMIGDYCLSNSLILKEIPPPISSPMDDYLISTQKIVVQGRFKEILVLVSLLEKSPSFGKIISLQFYLAKEKNSKKQILISVIQLQNISFLTS